MICTNCGLCVNATCVQLSEKSFRLTRCERCKAVADPYIEKEFVLKLLDMLLHKQSVYRHFLFNKLAYRDTGITPGVLLLFLVILVFDSYVRWVQVQSCSGSLPEPAPSSSSSSSAIAATAAAHSFLQDSSHYLAVAQVALTLFVVSCVEYLVFLSGVLLALRYYVHRAVRQRGLSCGIVKYNYALMAVVISSFGKVLYLLIAIWDYPLSFTYLVELFVMSSNIVAVTVFLESRATNAAAVVAAGILAKLVYQTTILVVNPHSGRLPLQQLQYCSPTT